jgi:hypothetical protein
VLKYNNVVLLGWLARLQTEFNLTVINEDKVVTKRDKYN